MRIRDIVWFGFVLVQSGATMQIAFWLVKGNIPNENFRPPPLEVHFGVRGCGRTDSAGGAGQE